MTDEMTDTIRDDRIPSTIRKFTEKTVHYRTLETSGLSRFEKPSSIFCF